MKIGGLYIRGISKRFWFVLAGVLLLLFVSSRVICADKPPVDRANVASPTPQSFSSAAEENRSGLEEFISQEIASSNQPKELPDNGITGLIDDMQAQEATPADFSVYRLRVYIPEEDAEAGVQIYRNLPGWQFYPAIPISAENAAGLQAIKEEATGRIAEDPDGDQLGEGIFLGFREGNVPRTGETYEVTGLLYTVYQQVAGQESGEAQAINFAPVFLADSEFRQIKDVEIEAPASYRAPLNIPIVFGYYRLDLKYLEWPSGGQPRLCAAISSSGVRPSVAFNEEVLRSTRMIIGGEDLGLNQEETEISGEESDLSADERILESGQPPITDYLLFDQTVSGQPQEDITLITQVAKSPDWIADSTDSFSPDVQTVVSPEQWQNVSTGKVQSSASCSGS